MSNFLERTKGAVEDFSLGVAVVTPPAALGAKAYETYQTPFDAILGAGAGVFISGAILHGVNGVRNSFNEFQNTTLNPLAKNALASTLSVIALAESAVPIAVGYNALQTGSYFDTFVATSIATVGSMVVNAGREYTTSVMSNMFSEPLTVMAVPDSSAEQLQAPTF